MDFDDLDDAEGDGEDDAAAAAAGAAGAPDDRPPVDLGSAEKPGPWNGKCLFRLKTSNNMPGRDQLPDRVKAAAKEKGEVSEVQVRLFILYGGGDSYIQWCQSLNDAPKWLDIGIHEFPGHGLRDTEQLSKDLPDLADDAWRSLEKHLKQHAKGGMFEGAPFALLGHSQGVLQMIEVASRARHQLGIEPCSVFAFDRPPPGPMGLTQAGYDLLSAEWPDEFYLLTMPPLGKMFRDQKDLAKVQRMCMMWQNDMRLSNEGHTQRPVGFHTFLCDVHVFMAERNWDADSSYAAAEAEGAVEALPADFLAQYRRISTIHGSGAMSYFAKEPYGEWAKWSVGNVAYHSIDIDHQGLKNNQHAWSIVTAVLEGALGAARAHLR